MTDRVIQPQPGPQEMFAACPADVAIYGGAAGGGKSFALVMECARFSDRPGFNAVIFRRTSTQLQGGGSVWEEARNLFPLLKGDMREHRMDCRFPSGARVDFEHLQYDKDVHSHQSKQYALICFDELTQFTEKQFWYMIGRNRTTSGINSYIRAATNPDPNSWVKRLIAWWLDDKGEYPRADRAGAIRCFARIDGTLHFADTKQELLDAYPDCLPLSLTFIPASLDDNPELTRKDPSYRAKLMALPYVDRMQLLGGNWSIGPAAGLYFRREMFEVLPMLDEAKVKRRVRGWDLASTPPSANNPDPDWTRGVKLAELNDGTLVIEHVASVRGTPKTVEDLLVKTATHDKSSCTIALWQDPGQAGKAQAHHYKANVLRGFKVEVERATKSKIEYAGPVSSEAEAGNITVVDGAWVDDAMLELERFPDGRHDDIVDALTRAYRGLRKRRGLVVAPAIGGLYTGRRYAASGG